MKFAIFTALLISFAVGFTMATTKAQIDDGLTIRSNTLDAIQQLDNM